MKCDVCARRTVASGGRCRGCQTLVRKAHAFVKAAGFTIEWVGGAWWVFDRRGNTLAIGEENKGLAVLAAYRTANEES